jgi:hypothetical protein
VRSLIRIQRNRQDLPTSDSNRLDFWIGTFNGFETVDQHLVRVIHPSGFEIRYVPTNQHVINSGVTFVVGTTLLRVLQHGAVAWIDSIPLGDPSLAPPV